MTRQPLRQNARIAIMGAGCAGLTCAEEFRDRGYSNITVFEAQRRPGGKIRSVGYANPPEGGRGLFEAGTVFFVPSPLWTKLLRRYRVSEACAFMPRVRVADINDASTSNPLGFSQGFSASSRAKQIWRFLSTLRRYSGAHDARPGIGPHVVPGLCGATHVWFDREGMPYVRDVLLPIAGGAQFGPLVRDVPVIYVLQLLTMLRRYSLTQQLRLAMPQLREGHEAVWTRVAASHNVRYGAPITRVTANGTVAIESTAGVEHFDALVVASPTDAYLQAATHLSAHERMVLSQVRTLERTVITARVSGLGRNVFYAPRYGSDGVVPPAHPYLFYEVDRGSGMYTFHPYLDDGRSVDDAERAIGSLVQRLGGRLESVEHRVVVRGWFPHFPERALRAGAYDTLESMQGRGNVWLAGELLAGVGVPRGMEFAAALVERIAASPVAVCTMPNPKSA